MIVTKYYIPFQMITLFDISIHKKLKGVLIFPYPEKQKFNRFRFYQNLGIASLLLGILGYTITLVPLLTTQARYLSNINKAPVRLAQTQGFQSISNTNYDFKIFIPKLSLDANIIDQVDPNIDREYTEKLKKGVAHAKGSAYPNQPGPTYLFSHSTDSIFNIEQYNAKFFGLKNLSRFDQINLSYNGNVYRYLVTGRKIIEPNDLSSLANSDSDLILSTCWPPGTDWQRLVVFATKTTNRHLYNSYNLPLDFL